MVFWEFEQDCWDRPRGDQGGGLQPTTHQLFAQCSGSRCSWLAWWSHSCLVLF